MKAIILFLTGLLVSVVTIQAQNWIQIGTDIDGEAAEDFSGSSVSISSDGSTVAIGAYYNDGNGSGAGHVRIYENNSGVWTQIGADIDGEASYDYSGISVDLSSNGSIVAIGAYGNGGNGPTAGHVRIYENNAGVWTQVGNDIDGEVSGDNSGQSVSLSSDGLTVAIGANRNDGNGNFAGHVRIYENNAGEWTQVGTDIDGEAEDDRSGFSVSLSSDGLTVAVGAWNNDGNGSNAGHVRIYTTLPIITNQPANQSEICVGTNVNYSVVGNNIDTYQWQVSTDDGTNWTDLTDNGTYSGTVTFSLSVTTNISLNNYQYSCIVSNAYGDVTSNVVILSFDTEAPVPDVIPLENIEVECFVDLSTYTPTATDICTGIVYGTTPQMVFDEQGTYTINWTYTDAVENSSTQEQTVIVDDVTFPTISCTDDQTIDLDEGQTSYIVQGTEFDPITTDDNCDGETVLNDYNNSGSLNGEEFTAGTYTITWIVTDAGENETECNFVLTVKDYVGIGSIDEKNISIYPNPTYGIITIENAVGYELTISDIRGKQIYNSLIYEKSSTINIENAVSGVYLINFKSDTENYTNKLIIE